MVAVMRCKHQMISGTCAFCLGLIKPDNQTQETEVDICEPVTEEEKDMETPQAMCPACGKNPSPGVRTDNGKLKICQPCRNLRVSVAMKRLVQKKEKPSLPEPSADVPDLPPIEQLKPGSNDNGSITDRTIITPAKDPEINLDEVKALVDAHWKYVEGILRLDGRSEGTVKEIGWHYRSAMLHGYKHGVEAATELG